MSKRANEQMSERAREQARGPGRGFTLIEILVVLVLMGLAAALVMPSFTRGLKGLELETTGRDLITKMKGARSEAVAQQRVFRIIVGEKSYVFANEFGEAMEQIPFPEGIVAEVGEAPVRIAFYSNGRSSGAVFGLRNQAGKRMGIEVDSITGFARALGSGE